MIHVTTSFCPDIERRCLDLERDDFNKIGICHAFAHEQRCKTKERPMDFCIDAYEYPNEKGAHPAWMLSWPEAQATCESKGKRLCWASEWTAACEGPDHSPFPYGWERDHDACNVDNFFIAPHKPGPRAQFDFYSKDREVRDHELFRLDQSVPSGALPSCASGFGVFDLTGNFDEWVTSDQRPRERSKYAGLKGGAWGHVRSQCRPMTTSHEPEFSYYFVSFRCCADAAGGTPWSSSPGAAPAPHVEPHDFAPDAIATGLGTGPSKTKFSRTGTRRE
jgi:formylglycine-generating enzyme required for sulfatase activity